MNAPFVDYLAQLGIREGDRIFPRVEMLYDIACRICPVEIEDLFVSNRFDGEGRQYFESLFFWTPAFLLESKHILAVGGVENNLDISLTRRNIRYCEWFWIKYNFQEASSDSRLNLRVHFTTSGVCQFSAAGRNCDSLFKFYLKYLKHVTGH